MNLSSVRCVFMFCVVFVCAGVAISLVASVDANAVPNLLGAPAPKKSVAAKSKLQKQDSESSGEPSEEEAESGAVPGAVPGAVTGAGKNAPAPIGGSTTGDCRALLLADPNSGRSIVEINAHEPLAPASMIKLMTTYVVMKRISEGQLKLTDMVNVTALASKMGGSQVYLRENEQFSVDDLLNALLIQSANDAAMALAEHVGGSKEGFVAMMADEATKIGMTESEFHSPHGLPPSKGDLPDKVSAHDFFLLASALLKQFPEVTARTKLYEAEFRGGVFKMINHNHLLRSFNGCDGMKTGYYGEAGFSITATAERNGSRLVTVVMGCKNRKNRDSEAARLMSMGFSQLKLVQLLDKGAPIDSSVAVLNGTKRTVTPIAQNAFSLPVRVGDEKNIEKRVVLCPTLQAPVKAGTPCGTVTYVLNGHELGKVEMVINEDIPALGFLGKVRRRLGM